MTLAKTVWTTSLANGAEVAENVIFFISGDGIEPDLVGALETAVPDYWLNAKQYFSPHTRLASISVQGWDDVTNTPTGVSTLINLDPDLAGTSVGRYLPTEVSEVVSLKTSTPGPSGRGRIYLPPTTADYITTDGYLSSEFQANMVDAWATLLTDIRSLTDSPPAVAPWIAAVYSRKNHVSDAVISVGIGSVCDVQRRRRRQLVESYITLPVPYTP